MVPGAKDNKVLVILIVLFQRFVSFESSIEILLIPPAANNKGRHVGFCEIAVGSARLPVLVLVWMCHIAVPGWKLTFTVLCNLRKGAQCQIPIICVLIERYVCLLF